MAKPGRKPLENKATTCVVLQRKHIIALHEASDKTGLSGSQIIRGLIDTHLLGRKSA